MLQTFFVCRFTNELCFQVSPIRQACKNLYSNTKESDAFKRTMDKYGRIWHLITGLTSENLNVVVYALHFADIKETEVNLPRYVAN